MSSLFVYGQDILAADYVARNTHQTANATSDPTTDQVTNWESAYAAAGQGVTTNSDGGHSPSADTAGMQFEPGLDPVAWAFQTDGTQEEIEIVPYRFTGERSDFFDSIADPSNGEFQSLVDQGSISQEDGRQTRYFQTEANPGDGVIVTEFVIQEEVSGGFLAGDGRALTDDPLGEELSLDESRMLIVIDRETGRGAITVSASDTSVDASVDVDFVYDPFGSPAGFPFRAETVPLEVGARPISFDERGWFDLVPENYFNIEASADAIRIDYDAINPITAPTQGISVDGPIVLERGDDGNFHVGDDHSPDLYPAVAVTQYKPDGSRDSIYFEEGKNVFEGATPAPIGELAEAARETKDEWDEAWRETGEANGFWGKTFQITEGAASIALEVGEGGLQTLDDAVVGGEIQEGAAEVRSEWDEAWRETGEANGVIGKTGQALEGTAEITGQALEGAFEILTLGKFS